LDKHYRYCAYYCNLYECIRYALLAQAKTLSTAVARDLISDNTVAKILLCYYTLILRWVLLRWPAACRRRSAGDGTGSIDYYYHNILSLLFFIIIVRYQQLLRWKGSNYIMCIHLQSIYNDDRTVEVCARWNNRWACSSNVSEKWHLKPRCI